jgi:hypothetical protein
MRKGVSGVRRVAAILSVSLVTLLVTSTGAGASAPKLVNYSGVGTGQVLSLKLDLPSALNAVLAPAGLSNKIEQVFSFSRSVSQVGQATKVGTGLGQVLDGTLNPLLQTVLTPLNKTLPRVFATLGETLKHDSLLEQDLGGLIHIGAMEVNAVSTLKTAADGLKAVVSHSDSKILGLKIDLSSIVNQLMALAPVQQLLDVVDAPGGLIDTLNGALNTVETTVNNTLESLNLPTVNLDIPKLAELLHQPLVSIGLIETGSDTGLQGIARTAKGITTLSNIDVLGGLVSIKSLSTATAVKVDGTKGGAAADAVSKIVDMKILGNTLDLTKGALKINGKSFALPLETVLQPLQSLLKDTLGLDIQILNTQKSASATHASAIANTLKIGLSPLNGALGLGLEIAGPSSMAEVQGSLVQGFEPSAPLPTTGVPTTAYFLAGPALLGMAVLVRRFALVK